MIYYDFRNYNKNLKWVKEIKETTVDDEGSVWYDEIKFKAMLNKGYKPTSPRYEELVKNGINDYELI